MARLRVFIAQSLDGFIAGEGDDLSWLPQPEPGASDHGYGAFMAEVGALLMGRRTFETVLGFGGPWPYGDRPVLVATRRPLSRPAPTVRAVEGDPAELVALALEAAGGRDVYLDGGDLIRQCLDADLIDALVVTIVPVVLGRGRPLFAGVGRRRELALVSATTGEGGLVQLTLARPGSAPAHGSPRVVPSP